MRGLLLWCSACEPHEPLCGSQPERPSDAAQSSHEQSRGHSAFCALYLPSACRMSLQRKDGLCRPAACSKNADRESVSGPDTLLGSTRPFSGRDSGRAWWTFTVYHMAGIRHGVSRRPPSSRVNRYPPSRAHLTCGKTGMRAIRCRWPNQGHTACIRESQSDAQAGDATLCSVALRRDLHFKLSLETRPSLKSKEKLALTECWALFYAPECG